LRAAKIVWRHNFDDERPFQREFEGIQRFERISREHPGQLALFHIGRNDASGYFYYLMELADAVESPKADDQNPKAAEKPKPETTGLGARLRDAPLGLRSAFDLRPSDVSYFPHTLRSDLQQGPLPPQRVLEIGLVLTEALANLHDHGLVHRDVKPSNVIFVNGRPKLADIGLVTDVGDGQSIVGTEGYMAPEGPGAPPADLFALGKVLYEASTGLDRRQFPRLPPDLLSWPDGQLVLELNEIILKACATPLDVRYGSAEQMRGDLEVLKAGQSVKRLRTVERRLAFLTRTAVVFSLGLIAASAVFYETYRQRQAAVHSLVRLHVANGTQLLNEGDLFSSLLSFTEALRLESGSHSRQEGHRIRIASVLRECPTLVGMFAHSNAPINDAAFSPNSQSIITAGDDHIAQMWDLATGRPGFIIPHIGPVYSVGFSPDGRRIATSSSDGLVHLWDSQTGKTISTAPIHHRGGYNGRSFQFSPDGTKLLTLTDMRTVVVWNAFTGAAVGQPLRHDYDVTSFMFSLDGSRILTICHERTAHLWHASTGALVYCFRHEDAVHCGAFALDGTTLATGGDDAYTRFWDLTSGNEIGPPLVHRHTIDFLAFSPEGGRLATVSRDGTVEVWDVATRRSLLRPLVHNYRVLRADFSPDGRWLAVSSEGNRVRLWDTDTGELLPPTFVHDTPRRPVIFSPDGHLVLALRHDLTLEREEIAVVWSLAREETPPLRIPPAASFQNTLDSPDRRFKATINGDTIHTLVSSSGKPLTQPLKQSVPFRQACFNREGSLLLTENVGGRGQVWDLSTGEPLTPLLGIKYDRKAQNLSKGDLQRALGRTQDLLWLAELLSGTRIDETGGFRPLDQYALMERWSALKRHIPALFIDSPMTVLQWHQRQASSSEQAWNWWSASFHLRLLVAAYPGDLPLVQRLAYARSALEHADQNARSYVDRRYSVVPPRNPKAEPELIDLSSFYNFSKRTGDDSIASLPSGLQTFAGTRFDVRGVVQLDDENQPGAFSSFPTGVCQIPINRICRRLHFLHATSAESPEDGTAVSSYVVHYADQRSLTVTNLYGRDLRSWWTVQGESLNSAQAVLVWMGTNRQVDFDSAQSLRMFKRTWENPWSDVEVTSIDFLSDGKGVGPFLVALTAD
jgi:WD40 repeat protein